RLGELESLGKLGRSPSSRSVVTIHSPRGRPCRPRPPGEPWGRGMPDGGTRRALLVAPAAGRAALAELIGRAGWRLAEADGLEQARFLLQAQPADALVLGGDLAGGEGLARLG